MSHMVHLKKRVKSLGGCLLSSEEFLEQSGLYTPANLPLEQRAALRTHMEERISANNHARSSSFRAAAHNDIV